jgi:toxin ParE1/3/4
MKVLISEEVENDLVNVFVYSLENFGEQIANNYLQDLKSLFKSLADNPKIGKSLFDLEYQVFFFRDYVIFYKIQDTDLKIIRIIHSSRDYIQILKD